MMINESASTWPAGFAARNKEASAAIYQLLSRSLKERRAGKCASACLQFLAFEVHTLAGAGGVLQVSKARHEVFMTIDKIRWPAPIAPVGRSLNPLKPQEVIFFN